MMDYYEKMYRALVKTIVHDDTKHLCGRSYRDAAAPAIEKNIAIGNIASKVYGNASGITSEEYRRFCEDLRQT